MKAIQTLLIVNFLFWLELPAVKCDEFDYKGMLGPNNWSKVYHQCSGKHQSPININDLTVEYKLFRPLILNGFDSFPLSGELHNNGHTVVVKLVYEHKVPTISSGPMPAGEVYQMTQFHFHWGANNTEGSEDRLNNVTFPAELHIVFRNANYSSFDDALIQHDGIVVLAFFFQIVDNDNEDYDELIGLLHQVIESDKHAIFGTPPNLMQLLNKDFANYYAYNGSLTTPPCVENVLWMDFHTPIKISAQQIEPFRMLKAHDGKPLTQNFRPIQPLNNRVIYRSVESPKNQSLQNSLKNATGTRFSINHATVFLLALLPLGTFGMQRANDHLRF